MVDLESMEPQIGVIGSLLLEPECVGECALKLRPEDFTIPRCRLIYQTILDMFREGKPVDPMLVRARLGDLPDIEKDLVGILEVTPTAALIWEYAAVVKEQGTLSALRELGRSLASVSSVEEAQPLLDKTHASLSERPGTKRMNARNLLEDFMDRHGEGKHPDYYTWGLEKLDRNLYIEQGDLLLLGGYPSAGKTALALRFAWHLAKTRRVGFYSLETKPAKLADRSVAALAGVDMGSIKQSSLNEADWEKVASQAGELAKRTLDMIPAGGMSVADLRADALANRYETVFIDYLQLLEVPKAFNRTEAVTGISIGLHQFAQGCGVTVVALSQLRRAETTKGGDEKAPTMSSLRESGQLEQDADAILLLHKDKPDDPNSRRILRIVKNKEGTVGKVTLDFDGRTQVFTEVDTHREAAAHFSAEGRKAQARNRCRRDLGQVVITELTEEQKDLPF